MIRALEYGIIVVLVLLPVVAWALQFTQNF